MIISEKKPDISKLPGGYIPDEVPTIAGGNPYIENIILPNYKEGEYAAFVIHDALTQDDCDKLIQFMDAAPVSAPVSVHGFMDAKNDIYGQIAGSVRTTMWCPTLADNLWDIISKLFDDRKMSHKTPTDWWQVTEKIGAMFPFWSPVAASPMMRFMKYKNGGEHYSHFDAGYFYEDDSHRTLMSYVIYLTTNENGGATRFIDDGQSDINVWDRDHSDWTEQAQDWRVLHSVQPKAGSILVFDHRLCHDVQPYHGSNPRIIVRGDVIYKPTNVFLNHAV